MVGTTVNIKAGGQTSANGVIVANEFGMIVTTGPGGANPEFVNTCKAEIIT